MDPELVSKDDIRFIDEVADQLSMTLLKVEWHPDFATPKLKALEIYEAEVRDETIKICNGILASMDNRKRNAEHDEDY